MSNKVGEDTFYEQASDRDDRYCALVHQAALEDPEWTARFLAWLRTEANMRSAALVGAAEFVKARLDGAGTRPGRPHETKDNDTRTWEGDSLGYSTYSNRRVIDSVIRRADEPGEMLAYWTAKYGRKIPQPVKRGITDAVRRLYDEKALLKYDTDSRGFRFGDVLELVHPSPAGAKASWQGDLFKHSIDRRHGRDKTIPESLQMIANNAHLMSWPVAERRDLFSRSQAGYVLKDAGVTWEQVAGWLPGADDRAGVGDPHP